MNELIVRTKTSRAAVSTPGMDSGNVIRQKTRPTNFAPQRDPAACSRSVEMVYRSREKHREDRVLGI